MAFRLNPTDKGSLVENDESETITTTWQFSADIPFTGDFVTFDCTTSVLGGLSLYRYDATNTNYWRTYVSSDQAHSLFFGVTDWNVTGGVRVILDASTTSGASLNIPEGTAPSSPQDGDIWVTSTDALVRVNGVSESIIQSGGTGTVDTSGTPIANDFARFTDADTIEGRSYAEVRADLSLEVGTDVQAHSAVLDATTASFTTADETKLDGIETGADVTDTTNVTAAGALMDSEVDADIKTLSLPASTTISTFGASLVDDASASAARTTLDVDQSGTDNSTDVSLAGTPNYITLAGQVLTRNQIDLTSDVTGDLPVADGGTGAGTAAGARTNLDVDQAGTVNYSHPNHTGDVTSTGDGATVIADEAVTLAKMAHMATDSLLGRDTGGTGDVEVLSASTVRSILNVENGATADQTAGEIEAIVDHDNLTGFVADEHIDWTSTSENFITSGTLGAGAITATSYGGITEANLLDKTASETITGTWTYTGTSNSFWTEVAVANGKSFYRYNVGNTSNWRTYVDGSDAYTLFTSVDDWNITAARVVFPASTTTKASINIQEGTAPTSPDDGDMWVTATDAHMQVNGITEQMVIPSASAAPTTGTHVQGYKLFNDAPTAGGTIGWVCTASGTFSSATDAAGDTDGSTAVITGMTDTSDFSADDWVTVSAGFPSSSTPYRIISKTASSVTLDTNSSSSQSNVTVATVNPVFKTWGDIAT